MAEREEEEIMPTIRKLIETFPIKDGLQVTHENWKEGDYVLLKGRGVSCVFGYFNGTSLREYHLDEEGWSIVCVEPKKPEKYWQWIYVGAGDKALHLTERFYTEEEAKDLSKKGLMGLKIVDRAHWTAIEYQE